jgi:cysteine dioxygenase|tara:strand:- start:53 stop:598 length:546 start_codon:yes stop_codon:yes gene_type:complete
MIPSIKSIQSLLSYLNKNKADADYYHKILENLSLNITDLEPFTFYKQERYTRNLIHQTKHCELMTLCWLPGQETAIHDHNQAEGWMITVQGEVTETTYPTTTSEQVNLMPIKSTTLSTGELSYINDNLAYHSIKCNNNSPSITLHLYAPPIDWCYVFDNKTKTKKKRKLVFDTINGKHISK